MGRLSTRLWRNFPRAGLNIMTYGTPKQVLEKIFRVFDVNSDGGITKKELALLVKDMYGLIKAEDPEALTPALIVESVFSKMDSDGNGIISQSEFISACLSPHKLSRMLALNIVNIFVPDIEE